MLSFLCHCPTSTFKIKNTRTTTRMSTATSTAAALPRPRGQSSSTTSKSKHQHNISEQCRQQIPVLPVCFAGYKEWQEGVKRLDFHCIVLGKKLSCQHRTPTTPNTNFTCVGFCCDVLHHSGKFHT